MRKKYLYDLEENTIVETQSSCLNNYTTKTEIVGEYRFVIKELVKRGIMRKNYSCWKKYGSFFATW